MTAACTVHCPAGTSTSIAPRKSVCAASPPAVWLSPRPGILLVDDDAWLRESIRTELLAYPCAVWTASDGYHALDLYRRHTADMDLVLLNDRMPGLSGRVTAQGLRRLNPAARYCLMTDSGGPNTREAAAFRHAVLVFHKPFDPAVAAGVLWQLVENECDPTPTLQAGKKLASARGLLVSQGVPEGGTGAGSPDDFEELARRVQHLLHGRVRDFRILVEQPGLILRGRACSYYAKQLAQQAVLDRTARSIARNEIEVESS